MSDAYPPTLFYVHDPMCSWCYGFAPVLRQLKQSLSAPLSIRSLVGGLAPDSDDAMPVSMREYLQQTWRRIEQEIPGTRFNFDFWTECQPRRSTYPACRAVLCAELMKGKADEMTTAIQLAYYQQARNPSELATLIELAEELGLDAVEFSERMRSQEMQLGLECELDFVRRRLGVDSFPSLILQQCDRRLHRLTLDYTDVNVILKQINQLMSPGS